MREKREEKMEGERGSEAFFRRVEVVCEVDLNAFVAVT